MTGSTCTLGPGATSRRGGSRLGLWPSSIPTKRRPLRRLRTAFGFVEVLAVVDHETDKVNDDDEAVED